MRLWHLSFAVGAASVMMAMARNPLTRAFLITLTTGLGAVFLGTTAVMALFQTIGALGEAKGLSAHLEAIATTSMVLGVATVLMSAWLFVGAWFLWITS